MANVAHNQSADRSTHLLMRYLGATSADLILRGQAEPYDLFAAYAQLASARYAVSTYLPRRLSARQSDQSGPWLEWVKVRCSSPM